VNKYNAQKTILDGIVFASKREARRYGELKILERAKIISGLELQPRFPLKVADKLICIYIGDFSYIDSATGKRVCEDSKGFVNQIYKLKRKLLYALYPDIDHREV
jgi:hypothetical protein